ncbi:MAG: hypothetical protein F4X56_06650 [Gammaproteobacteria bacterium]|nr:hypothetical protein [Gammaproteobacteria bacterium]MXW06938.1 hypothetical protein [Gammaproteobacteria bacterium]MYC25578.1 hypothetical protein [Gammaproteobacteria bacterium]
MSDVQNWDPTLSTLGQTHRDLLNSLEIDTTDKQIQLTSEQLDILRVIFLIDARGWTEFAEDKNSAELICWIKLLSLVPEQYSGFDSGAKSPVISLVRVLRQRGGYPTYLTAWIKQHSTNRFLPYGSLTDRLSKI